MDVAARRAVAALVVVVLVGAACADAPSDRRLSPGSSWTRVPASPLSPRFGALALWVGQRVVVVGGSASDPCPPGAACVPPSEPPLSDGATFDPQSATWQRIADAPVPIRWASGAVVDDALYLWVPASEGEPEAHPAFLSYDVAEDRWDELPMPPVVDGWWPFLASYGHRIVAYQSSQEVRVLADLVFDPTTGTWSELPRDPLVPSFDRSMVGTDAGLVLIGIENVPQPGSDGPAVYRAAVLDPATGAWRRLPDSEIAGYDPSWFSAGGVVVNPTLGTSDGGEVNAWERAYPHGGILDPALGTWSPLPDPPPSTAGEWSFPPVAVGGSEYVSSFSGWALHVPSGRWFELSQPPGRADEGQAITWADDRLFVWGGVAWEGPEPAILGDGWLWSATSSPTPIADGTAAALDEPPELPASPFSLWLSAERVAPGPAELIAVLVDHEGVEATFGVAAKVERWDGREWVAYGDLVMCMDHWHCTARVQPPGEVGGVPAIGLSATPGRPGPVERFTTDGLDVGWYRISQEANEGIVAAAILEIAEDASVPPPLVPVDDPSISVSPALVSPDGGDVYLSPLIPSPTGAQSREDVMAAIRGLSEVAQIERWDGSEWEAAGDVQLHEADDDLARSADLPPLPEGEYRLVREGPRGPHIGQFWIDGTIQEDTPPR